MIGIRFLKAEERPESQFLTDSGRFLKERIHNESARTFPTIGKKKKANT